MSKYTICPIAELPTDVLGMEEHLYQLLYNRKVTDTDAITDFLSPNYDEHLHDPMLLHDMDTAVARLRRATERNEHIGIFADYDCDGIPGAVLFHDFLTAIGHENFTVKIPHRHFDGFGLSVEAVEELAEQDVTLIITIDCGTSDHEAVTRANELGVDVVITDHHEPKETLPEAVAVVNPKVGDNYPFPHLCGTGVAFKFIQAMLATGDYDVPPGQEKWWLDMVGIATIADMVPLTDENRVLAHYGLLVLKKSRRPGIQQLLRKQRVDARYLTEDDIGFTIGPRINAASRMDTPEDAFALLTATDVTTASERLEHLERLNQDRKTAVALMTKDLHKRMKVEVSLPDVIVMGDPEWRPSLVGLSANKLAEEYNRPVFLWGRDGNGASKGSTRSNGITSVVALMEGTPDSFVEYGGHHASGGFTVQPDAIFDLPMRLQKSFETLGAKAQVDEPLSVDMKLNLAELDSELLKVQKQCAPFGMENPKPLYLVENVTPSDVSVFGKTKEHTKLTFDGDQFVREAIAFFKLPQQFSKEPKVGEKLSLLAHLEESFFMGRRQVRLRIVDII